MSAIYSIEKEANKCHSGRLINQDQNGRIEASYIMHKHSYDISVIYTRPPAAPLVSCNNTDITLVVVI